MIVRLQPWKAHDRSVKDLALMDEDKIISCSKDKLIKIWDKYLRYKLGELNN